MTKWTLLAVVAAGALITWAMLAEGTGSSNRGDDPTFAVRRGPLTISVSESGTIKAREKEIIKSEVEGQTTIIYLIEEGTRVNAGDLLVELDTSSLEEKEVEQQIKVQNAETEFIRARESLEVVKNQAESDIAAAALEYRFAQEDLTQYKEGEYPKLLKEAEARITLEKEELENAADKLDWSEKLFKERYISETELEADRLARSRATLDFQLAEENLKLLKNYTYVRRIDELESNIDQTQRALERVKLQASSELVQARADLTNTEAELERQRDKLLKLQDQIRRAKIHAPIDGMVVYASSSRAHRRGNDEPLDEGQSVRERQELIHLPTTSAIMAEIKVHESNLDKIDVGLPVIVTVDALPGKSLRGRVASIAPLPDPQSVWMNPDLKVYRTEIDLEAESEVLRTGMSCEAEIIVEHHDDTLYVPVQSVVRIGADTVVYVPDEDGSRAQTVEIGLDNNRMVRIVSGVEENDLVLLNPPLSSGAQRVEESRSAEVAELSKGLPPAREKRSAPSAAPAGAEPAGPAAMRDDPRGEEEESPRRGRMRRERGDGERERGERRDRRGRWGNMSEEERAKMRERWQNMSPEEREAMMRERSRSGRGRREGRDRDRDQ